VFNESRGADCSVRHMTDGGKL